jgi:hypothetical protein
MTKTGQIKIYSPETGCGVIQADDDSRVVLFFRRSCVVALYSPAGSWWSEGPRPRGMRAIKACFGHCAGFSMSHAMAACVSSCI